MEIKKILSKENLSYLGNLIKKLPIDILLCIMIALFLIALILDCLIAHTFPAYTLIAGIIFITVAYCKLSLKIRNIINAKQEEKEQKKNFEALYSELELYIDLLEDVEKQLLKKFVDEKKQRIVCTLNEYMIFGQMLPKHIDFIHITSYPQANKQPLYIMEISPVYYAVLVKYFEE